MVINQKLENRFWSKVKKSDDCWNWLASKNHNGYGRFGFSGTWVGAHRVSFELTNGEIPTGLSVLHKCDNPSCVNPGHLWLGSQQDNIADMFKKNRRVAAHGEKAGLSKLTEKQVIEIRSMSGKKTNKAIAEQFNVSNVLIGLIMKRKIWRHL